MSVEIIIEPMEVRLESRTANGNTFYKQTAYVKLPGEKFPRKCSFGVPDAVMSDDPSGFKNGYAAGTYTVDPSSFQIGKYDKLELNPFSLYLVKCITPAAVKTELKAASK